MTADVADMKVSEPAEAAAPPSKPEPDASTSMAAKHEEEYPHEEETAEERAKREAELQKIYADLAKEDDRCCTSQLRAVLALYCNAFVDGLAAQSEVANVLPKLHLNTSGCF